MIDIANDEQWLLNGDCSKCKRKYYCNDRCKRNIQVTASKLHELFYSKLSDAITKKNRR